mgnify:CR=1 FL=1
MAEAATTWLGLVFLGVIVVLLLLGSVLRERRVGDHGSTAESGPDQLLVWLGIGFALVAMIITVLLRFDAVI